MEIKEVGKILLPLSMALLALFVVVAITLESIDDSKNRLDFCKSEGYTDITSGGLRSRGSCVKYIDNVMIKRELVKCNINKYHYCFLEEEDE